MRITIILIIELNSLHYSNFTFNLHYFENYYNSLFIIILHMLIN